MFSGPSRTRLEEISQKRRPGFPATVLQGGSRNLIKRSGQRVEDGPPVGGGGTGERLRKRQRRPAARLAVRT
jgi:hypothetical protein